MSDETRWWLIGTGVLMAVGAFLPWVQAGLFSLAGTDGDGVFVLMGGVIIILIGLSKKATAVTGAGAVAISVFALWIVVRIFADVSALTTDSSAILAAGPGTGLFVSGAGALFAFIAGVKTFSERPRSEPTLPGS